MLYTLFVLLLAPVFAYLWIKLKDKNIIFNAPKKLAIGIILAAFGIFSFLFASLTNLVLTGIITGNLLLSAGELVLSPSIYTAISDLAPEGMKSTMMGCWLLFVALGGYVSSILANIAHSMSEKMLTFHSIYSGQFLLTGLFTGSVGIIVIMMVPKLTKMMR